MFGAAPKARTRNRLELPEKAVETSPRIVIINSGMYVRHPDETDERKFCSSGTGPELRAEGNT